MNDFIYNPPAFPYLDILYFDDDIMVVNKPSGLLSVPGRLKENFDSVISRAKELNQNASSVHRLDMDTSGILIVGLSKAAISNLGKAFINKEIKKYYLALVDGDIDNKGEVTLPIRCDLDNRPLQIVDFEQGKPSHTIYQKISDYKVSNDIDCNNTSLVLLTPITGRSHQLRVHMQQIGHPILGDRFYANDNVINKAKRLCLHAFYLEFNHPITGKKLIFKTKPSFLEKLNLNVLTL